MKLLCVLLAAATCTFANALSATPTPPDLPPDALARQALDADAQVATARAGLDAARIEGQITAEGPHEFNARATRQQRKIRDSSEFTEWSATLERPIRWPGKAALDRKLGEATVAEAEARYGDALHQASRDLLALWMEWLGASYAKDIVAAQRQSSQANVAVVEKRYRAGDAARLDVNAAMAEAAELARAASEMATQAAAAEARLQSRFPAVQPQRVVLSDPRPVARDLTAWQQAILAHSHELRIPQAKLARAQAAAERARAERLPDPTLGAYVASEMGGNEKIIGALVSMPIPGARRTLQVSQANAATQVARYELEAQTRAVGAEIASNVRLAQGHYETWRTAAEAATAAGENMRLLERAYALGETDLQAVLLARRQSLAARLTEHQSRVAALRAHYLLLVDAHEIWDMEESDH